MKRHASHEQRPGRPGGGALLLRAALLALLAAACAQPAPPARGVTVVSGYWKISSKHSNEDYATWFSNTLRVDAPYVFYYGAGPSIVGAQADAAAEGVRSVVAASRGSRRTRFVRRDMSAFRSFGTYDAGWTHRRHVPTTALALVWLEKVALMADAAAHDDSGADWFAWVDAGIAAYRTGPPPAGAWPDATHLATLPTDKLIYSGTGEQDHDFAGTAFLMPRSLISRIDAAFEVQRGICAARVADWRCGSDQIIFTEMRSRLPSLFYKITVGYGAVVQELYNKPPASVAADAAYWGAACGTRVFKPLAVATLVSTPAYVDSANVLWFSLRKTLDPELQRTVDFVALLIGDHGDAEVARTRAALIGWQPCVVPPIPPLAKRLIPSKQFREQFTKLALWNATMYKRILYLDADTLAVRDPALALTSMTAPFAAARDWENGAQQAHFNMGVASMVPNANEFARLDAARRTRRDYRIGMAEQELLNAEYNGTFQELPFEYNANLAAAAQRPAFWAAANASMRIIHFTWIKPFDADAARHRDFAACKGALDQWHTARAQMMDQMALPEAAATVG